MPLIASILSAIFAGTTSAIAAAEQAAAANGAFPWGNILEKGGTIGALVWVVLIFKKRSEEQDSRNDKLEERLEKLMERSIVAIEKGSDAEKVLGESNKSLAEAVNRLRDSLSK